MILFETARRGVPLALNHAACRPFQPKVAALESSRERATFPTYFRPRGWAGGSSVAGARSPVAGACSPSGCAASPRA